MAGCWWGVALSNYLTALAKSERGLATKREEYSNVAANVRCCPDYQYLYTNTETNEYLGYLIPITNYVMCFLMLCGGRSLKTCLLQTSIFDGGVYPLMYQPAGRIGKPFSDYLKHTFKPVDSQVPGLFVTGGGGGCQSGIRAVATLPHQSENAETLTAVCLRPNWVFL